MLCKRDKSGRSGRRRGSQKSGTATDDGALAVALSPAASVLRSPAASTRAAHATPRRHASARVLSLGQRVLALLQVRRTVVMMRPA